MRFARARSAEYLSRAALLVLLGMGLGCGSVAERTIYEAERRLFKADKMKSELADEFGFRQSGLLDNTIGAYRAIVTEFAPMTARVPGLDAYVVAAQIDIADLEAQVGRHGEALEDFHLAVDLAAGIPVARAYALYSAARLAEQLGHPERAIEYHEVLYRDHLRRGDASATNDPRLLVTPLKLAELHERLGSGEAEKWLDEAETLYRDVAASAEDPDLLREARFNLLATRIQQRKWDDALELSERLAEYYPQPSNLAAVTYLRARIFELGLEDTGRAAALYREVSARYPESIEAPRALLATGAIEAARGNLDAAVEAFEVVVRSHARHVGAAAEAEWQLAQIEEARNQWVEAALRYKSITASYPGTSRALEAPLRLAAVYRELGEEAATSAAYAHAIEEYEKITKGAHPLGTRIRAEDFIYKAYVQQDSWDLAARHLLELPERYPRYEPYRENYIIAARIYKEQLDDRRNAVAALERCIHKYPDTETAARASEQLALLDKRK